VLGEMSMIDGEPRFASCTAIDRVSLAVLTRDDMGRILVGRPALGAKILVKLVTMLSQRLRKVGADLVRSRGH
jgi:CRP-like cAMP-binding protein